MAAKVFKVRSGQRAFERFVRQHRVSGLLARRQYGKTTIASRIALRKMMKVAGHTVIFGSVKIDLGREMVRKESAALQQAFQLIVEQAKSANMSLQLNDMTSGKSLPLSISTDDFAELYEATRLEFRLFHSNTVYSRTKVVALTPDAVGETGDLILDEVGRCKRFQDVLEAMMPIIAADPEYRAIFTTTPPPDDTHASFGLLAPPIDAVLPVNPAGNTYRSQLGIHVLRITAQDAFADGIPLYDDDSGEAISPEKSRENSSDKDAWDRNYDCKFVIGGTGACGLMQLDTAQRRGIGECQFFNCASDSDVDKAAEWLSGKLTAGRIGLGWDLATTTKQKSNPSSLSVVEERGVEKIVRAIILWKTADPDIALERVRKIIRAVENRRQGGPARRLCIDGTNERYFAATARKELCDLVQVEVVIASETIERQGNDPITMKQYQGGLLVGELDDNHLWLPPERYVLEDFRLVKKEKGMFVCEPDAAGRHGDTFDSTKQANYALIGGSPFAFDDLDETPESRTGWGDNDRNVMAL